MRFVNIAFYFTCLWCIFNCSFVKYFIISSNAVTSQAFLNRMLSKNYRLSDIIRIEVYCIRCKIDKNA